MRYHDFEIRFRGEGQGEFLTEVLRSPYAQSASAPFRLPFDAASIPDVVRSLESCILAGGGESIEPRDLGYVREAYAPTLSPQAMGAALFESLFSGSVGEAFQESLAHIRGLGSNEGLRVRLSFDLNDQDTLSLIALPWELLLQVRMRDFLGRQRHTAIVRDFPLRRTLRMLQAQPPMRVLLISARPRDLPDVDCIREVSQIQRALEVLASVEVSLLSAPTPSSLREMLLKWQPHVLHYIGHGTFNFGTGQSLLFFEDSSGRSSAVTGEMMGEILKGIDTLQLVILNACKTGIMPRLEGQSPYAAIAPSILLAGVPAVIAMQFSISTKAAILFSDRLYKRLATGDPIDAAVAEGRLAIHIEDTRSFEWATPALFLNGGQWEIPHFMASLSPVLPAVALLKRDSPLRVGIRSFRRWGEELGRTSDLLLDLTEYFEEPSNRRISDPVLWNGVIGPAVRDFLASIRCDRRPIILDFAAHASIAFLAGYCLEVKSGLDITIIQRTHGGSVRWRALEGARPCEPLWLNEPEDKPDPGALDVILALSVSDQVIDDVEVYRKRVGIAASRIISASIAPSPSTTAIQGGMHALCLVQRLSTVIKRRSLREREGTLHIFSAAPNGFMFFLGQLSHRFGRVQLYEYDLETGCPGAYEPSVQVPSCILS